MKVSTLSVSAMVLAPTALANDLEARQINCVKQFALGTITSLLRPTITITEVTRVPKTVTVNTTVVVKKSVTVTVPTTIKTTVTSTSTSVVSRTAAARTVSSKPVTSTVAAPAGFTAAAAAFATVSKRDAEAEPQRARCTTTIMDDKTVMVTGTNTLSITVIATRHGGRPTTVTNSVTVTKGRTATTVFNTITSTITKNTLALTTTTVTPTVTVAAPIVTLLAACGPANLLDYTFSTGASSNGTKNGDDDGEDDDSNDYSRRLASRDFPKMRMSRRQATGLTKVGINDVANTNDYTVRSVSMVSSAYACCAACQIAMNCAGSVYSSDSGCSLYVATSCSSGQAKSAGTFTYDSSNALAVGAGEVVSNGKCGVWTMGGDTADS